MQSSYGSTFSGDLTIGSEVFTSDGDRIGEVKEMRGGFFKIDVPMQPDFWLPLSTVASGTAGRVMLNVHKDHLGDYKESEPRAA